MPKVQFTKVKCSEVADSRRISYSPVEGLVASIELYIAMEDIYDLLHDLAYNPYTRAWPYTKDHPEFQSLLPIPVEIAVRPFRGTRYDDGGQGIDYKFGIATITYRSWTPTRERVEFQSQSIRLDPKLFKWANSAYTNDSQQPTGIEGLSQPIRRLILVKEYDNITFDFPNNFFGTETTTEFRGNSGFIGTVHNADYISSLVQLKTNPAEGTEFVTFKANTLLMLDPVVMDGPQYVTEPDNSTTPGAKHWRRGYRYKFRWLFRPEGHNVFWRPALENETGKRGSWDSVVMHGSSQPYEPFPTESHSPLLSNSLSEKLQEAPKPMTPENPIPVIDLPTLDT